MADNETIADIIAEMREISAEKYRLSSENGGAYGNPGVYYLDFAQFAYVISNRLEAAHKREKAAIEADALSVGGLVEAMRQKEAICTKCRDGEPPKNCQFFGEPDGCSSPTYGHYPQLPIGDAAKLREAVIRLRDRISMFYKNEWIPYDEWEGANDDANSALAVPPRNCDVYATVEEARKVWCGTPSRDWDYLCDWLYAPATEKEGGAK